MSEDVKFPKKELFEVEFQYYETYDIQEWFRRCIEDYPKYPDGLGDKTLQDVVMERHMWFMRWFRLFMGSEKDE